MQITKTLLAAVLTATSVSAAPVAGSDNSSNSLEVRDPQWIIEHMSRSCDGQDQSCTWSFAIDTQLSDPTWCNYVVNASGGQPASRSNGGPVTCGDFTITSGWSGQFAVGFTTFAVVENSRNLIVFPAYDDNEIAAGNVPNKAYTPTTPSARRI